MTTLAKAQAQLQAAIDEKLEEFNALESHWSIANTDDGTGAGVFGYLKNGKPRKTPTFYLFFNSDNPYSQWSVSDGSRKRSFVTAREALRVLLAMASCNDGESARSVLLEAAQKSIRKPHDNSRLADRAEDELIGLCKGILFNGFVTYEAAYRLLQWIEANPSVLDRPIGGALYPMLVKMLNDGQLGADDDAVLLAFFAKLGGSVAVLDVGHNPSSALPLDDPAPTVIVNDSLFVLTGNFRLGSRAFMIDFIKQLGGRVSPKSVVVDTDYLIIGDVGSEKWRHSSYGSKIERAIELRNQKRDIAIISEAHFLATDAVKDEIERRGLVL
jgi:hypothetical protein